MKKLLIIMTMLIMLSSSIVALDTSDPNLVVYYNGEANLTDVSGNGFDGIENGTIINTTTPLLGTKAWQYDDVNDFVDVPITWDDNLAGGNFTINIWARIHFVGASALRFVADRNLNLLDVFNIRDQGTVEFVAATGNGVGTGWSSTSQADVIDHGKWQMYTFIRDGTNCYVYMNGTLKGSGVCDSPNNDLIRLGNDFDLGSALLASFDEVSFWNRTLSTIELGELFNGGAGLDLVGGAPPAVSNGTLTVNLRSPTDGDLNNTQPLDFTYNVTSGSPIDNCTLYGNFTGTWEANVTNSSVIANNTNNSFLGISLEDGMYIWNVECGNSADNITYADQNFSFTVDTTNPILVTDFINNTRFYTNLTGQFNFSDLNNIYSVNITIPEDSFTVFNMTGINLSSFSYNMSFDLFNIGRGNKTLQVRFADTHTALDLIDPEAYKPSDGFFGNYIEYRFEKPYKSAHLKIEQKSSSVGFFGDKWTTSYDGDGYIFNFTPNIKSDQYTFVVSGGANLDIVTNPNTPYKKWLIFNDEHWIDFYPYQDISMKRINRNSVEVTIGGVDSKQDTISFKSIGDLNIVYRNYTFFSENISESFTANILNNESTTLYFNFNGLGHAQPANVILDWNNTNYTVPINTNTPTLAQYNQSIDVLISGSGVLRVPHKWFFNLSNVSYMTNVSNQTIQNPILDNCTDANSITINYTFRDEGNNSVIEGDPSGPYNYGIGSGNIGTYNLDLTNVEDYRICLFPNVTFTGNYTLAYSSDNYPLRRFSDNSFVFLNVTQQINLYLLHIDDGSTTIFQVVDSFSNVLSEVTADAQRSIGGSYSTVELETTDDAGLATFFLNPDIDYSFIFTKSGFKTNTFTLRPSSSEIITVTMESTIPTQNQSLATGITYAFTPTSNLLMNDTTYNFNFELTSSGYRHITNCTLFLKNLSETFNSSNSSFTTTSCSITIPYFTGNQTTIVSEVFYSLNNSDLIRASKQYKVRNVYSGNFSLKNFFDDIESFRDSGFNNTSRMIIALIVIFSITAFAAKKVELVREPEVLIVLVITMLWFFSYLGWFTLTLDSIPDLRGQKEHIQQYMILFLVSLIGIGYIIKREIRI